MRAFLTRYWHQSRGHRGLIVAAAMVAAAVAAVVELSDDVMEGDTRAFDEKTLLMLRRGGDAALPLGPDWLPHAVADLTALGSYTVLGLVAAAALGFCATVRRYDIAGFLGFCALGALALNIGLKSSFARPRPEVVEGLAHVASYSYPSGHALMSSAIYLSFAAVFAEMAKTRAAQTYLVASGLVLAGLVGLSRLYLGVHYPTDVLAGWAIGIAWALFCWMVVEVFKRRAAAVGRKDAAV